MILVKQEVFYKTNFSQKYLLIIFLQNDAESNKSRTDTTSNNRSPQIDDVDSTVSSYSDGISCAINLPDVTVHNNPDVHDNSNDDEDYDNNFDDNDPDIEDDDNVYVDETDGSFTDTDLSTEDETSADSDVNYGDEHDHRTNSNNPTRPQSFLSTDNMPNSDMPLFSKPNITLKDHPC